MEFSFKSKIYKVGINLCVEVPSKITAKLHPMRGYIPVSGKINKYPFKQTLVPVKDAPYRLFVNGGMLKGSGLKLGDTAHFSIEQDFDLRARTVSLPKEFKILMQAKGVYMRFKGLIPSRKKEILKYLSHLKSEDARLRNMYKVINQLKQ
jgi:hypothetical protein